MMQVWTAVQVVAVLQAHGVRNGGGDGEDDCGQGRAIVRVGLPYQLRNAVGPIQWLESEGRELEAPPEVCGGQHHAGGPP